MAEKSETGSGFCVFFLFFARQAKNSFYKEKCVEQIMITLYQHKNWYMKVLNVELQLMMIFIIDKCIIIFTINY